MRLLAADLDGFWDEDFAARFGVERAALADLLRESDFVSIHLRPPAATDGIIGAGELEADEADGASDQHGAGGACRRAGAVPGTYQRAIAGAALDTIVDNGLDTPLLGLPNVVGTPHIGGRCLETAFELVDAAIENALTVLRGERPDPSSIRPCTVCTREGAAEPRMKITNVECIPVQAPGRTLVPILVSTDEGITGVGEAGLQRRPAAIAGAVEHLRPLAHRRGSRCASSTSGSACSAAASIPATA